MATYGDSFSTSLPAVGSSGPQYATDMNSILTDIMTRLASKVPLSSLLVTSDFSLGSYNLTNASTVGLVNLASVNAAGTSVPRVEAVNGDFYFVGPSGAVKITAGTSLNAAGLAGITGDYGGVNPAQFRYDSANTRYDAFANQGTGQWAYVRGLGFDIAAGATSTVRARLLFAGVSNMAYTLPSSSPASQALLQMDNTGAITANNSLAANTNLGLSGTGRVTRGQRSTTMPLEFFRFKQFSGATGVSSSVGNPVITIPASCDVIHPIMITDADNVLTTITSVDVIRDGSGGSLTCTLYLSTPLGYTVVAGSATTSTASTITCTPTTPYTPSSSNEMLWLRVQNSTGLSTQGVHNAVIHSTVS